MALRSTQFDYPSRGSRRSPARSALTPNIDRAHVNPSLLEGENLYESSIGFRRAKALDYFPPVFTVGPWIAGDLTVFRLVDKQKVYSTLVCERGIIEASERARVIYQWYQEITDDSGAKRTRAVPGADTPEFPLREEHYNIPLWCRVTARNRSGGAVAETSRVVPEIITAIRAQEYSWGIVTGLQQEGNINLMGSETAVLQGVPSDRMTITNELSLLTVSTLDPGEKAQASEMGLGAVTGLPSPAKGEVRDFSVGVVWQPVYHRTLTIPNHDAEGNLADWTLTPATGIVTRSRSPSPAEGTRYFSPGNVRDRTITMVQTVSLDAEDHTIVDDGEMLLQANWLQSGETHWDLTPPGSLGLDAAFLDSGGTVLSSSVLRRPFNPGHPNAWTRQVSGLTRLPEDTRSVRITFTFLKTSISTRDIYKSYLDDIEVRLFKEKTSG